MPTAVDLPGVPDDILVLLAERLPSLADTIRFGAVCRSMASAAGQRRRGTYIPYLLVPDNSGGSEQSDHSNGNLRNLFCLSSQRVHRGLRFPEEARQWRCFGSCHAWLLMVDLDAKSRLLNPMSGAQVELPSLSTFPDIIDVIEWPPQVAGTSGGGGGGDGRRPLLYLFEWMEPDKGTPANRIVDGYVPIGYDAADMRDVYMFKMCLSSPDPQSDPGCIVMVIYSGMRHLAYCKPGDSKWTAIETPWHCVEDVIYHRGNFYAGNDGGRIVVVDLASASVREVAPLPPYVLLGRKYLVGLPSGGVLFVVRELKGLRPYRTVNFLVFNVDINSSRPQWKKVNSLGNFTMFLGHSSSVLLSSSQVSGACRGNCIYFTDDYSEGYYQQRSFGGHDMGIFDMQTKRIERYYPSDSKLLMPSPTWITPNPS